MITDLNVEVDRAVVHTIGGMHYKRTLGRSEYEILDKLTLKDCKIIEFIEFLDTDRIHKLMAEEP